MMVEIGRYLINFGAIVAIVFAVQATANDLTEEICTVHLTGGLALAFNAKETAIFRNTIAAIAQYERAAAANIAVPPPPNIRGLHRN